MRILAAVNTGDIIHGQTPTTAILIIITIATTIIINTIIIGGIHIVTGIIMITPTTFHTDLQRKPRGIVVLPDYQMILWWKMPTKIIQALRLHKVIVIILRLTSHIMRAQKNQQLQPRVKQIRAMLNHVENIIGNHYE